MKLETKRFRLFNPTHWFYVVLVLFLSFTSMIWAKETVSIIDDPMASWKMVNPNDGLAIIVISESGSSDDKEISKSLGEYVYKTINSNIDYSRIQYLGLASNNIPTPIKLNKTRCSSF